MTHTSTTKTWNRRSEAVEQHCVRCGNWTKSHPIPMGWLCHSCATDDDVTTEEIHDILGERVINLVERDSPAIPVTCWWCETEHSLRDALTERIGLSGALARETLPEIFGEKQSVVLVSCEECGKTSEYAVNLGEFLLLADATDLESEATDPEMTAEHARGDDE